MKPLNENHPPKVQCDFIPYDFVSEWDVSTMDERSIESEATKNELNAFVGMVKKEKEGEKEDTDTKEPNDDERKPKATDIQKKIKRDKTEMWRTQEQNSFSDDEEIEWRVDKSNDSEDESSESTKKMREIMYDTLSRASYPPLISTTTTPKRSIDGTDETKEHKEMMKRVSQSSRQYLCHKEMGLYVTIITVGHWHEPGDVLLHTSPTATRWSISP